jgi:hypothetical protein
VNGDTSHPILWQVPQGDNHFTTPAIAAPGSFGQAIPLAFYLLSRDPQGHRNTLVVTITPVVLLSYTPTEGVIIPSRNPLTPQWFSSEFSWVNNAMTVDSIGAGKIQVGSLLQVGGQNSFATTAQNGQIGVFDVHNKMVGWIGVAQVSTGQQPQNSVGSNNYGGAWFGQLWVGGDSPAHAPVWVDQNGVVMVGGIAAQTGSPYPYISVRDAYGIERGRMGAQLANPPAPGDSNGSPAPTGVTAGAWFTQLAAGGSSATGWQILIDGSTSPGTFKIRDTDPFSINFAANPNDGSHSAPWNPPYTILMGKSVWAGVGSNNNTWQFPGIQIYEGSGPPANASQIFGSVLSNRGLVLRGRPEQNYGPIVTLAMVNGDSNGSDVPSQFWGQLALHSPVNPSVITVDIASGHLTGGVVYGDSHLYLSNSAGNYTFTVDEGGQVHFNGRLYQGWGPGKELVDDNGNWVGGGGSAVTSLVAGTGISLNPTSGTGAVTVTNAGVTLVRGGNGTWIDSSGGVVTVSVGLPGNTATVDFGYVSASANPGYGGGAFGGAGVQVGANGISGGSLTVTGQITGEALAINPSGTTPAFTVSNKTCCDYNGTWTGNGVQSTNPVAGQYFGIIGGVGAGWAVQGVWTFKTADNKTVTVNGGIVMSWTSP